MTPTQILNHVENVGYLTETMRNDLKILRTNDDPPDGKCVCVMQKAREFYTSLAIIEAFPMVAVWIDDDAERVVYTELNIAAKYNRIAKNKWVIENTMTGMYYHGVFNSRTCWGGVDLAKTYHSEERAKEVIYDIMNTGPGLYKPVEKGVTV